MKLVFKIYKHTVLIKGELNKDHIQKILFVELNGLICEIENKGSNVLMVENKLGYQVNNKTYVEKTEVSLKITSIKNTSGCDFFLQKVLLFRGIDLISF